MSATPTTPRTTDDARPEPGRWITVRQIARDLRVSTSTAYKWSARGVPWFPRHIRLKNGDIRVRRDWYEEWLRSQETI